MSACIRTERRTLPRCSASKKSRIFCRSPLVRGSHIAWHSAFRVNGCLLHFKIETASLHKCIMSPALIYMIEGSIGILMLLAIPIVIFENIAVLPYIILNQGSIVGNFLS